MNFATKTKLVLFTVVFVIAYSVAAQDTVTVTLNVDTTNLNNQNVDESCDFGQPFDIPNEEFTIEVGIDDTVVWEGLSSTSDTDVVEIVSIKHENGPKFFNFNSNNELGGSSGKVRGRIVRGQPGQIEKYTIRFRVFRNGRRVGGTYKIDPKIVIKTRG